MMDLNNMQIDSVWEILIYLLTAFSIGAGGRALYGAWKENND